MPVDRVRNLLFFAIVVLVVVLGLAPKADAQTYVGVPPPAVGGSDSGAAVLPVQLRAPDAAPSRPVVPEVEPASTLALTGADVVGLIALGAAALIVGMALVRTGRRRGMVGVAGPEPPL